MGSKLHGASTLWPASLSERRLKLARKLSWLRNWLERLQIIARLPVHYASWHSKGKQVIVHLQDLREAPLSPPFS